MNKWDLNGLRLQGNASPSPTKSRKGRRGSRVPGRFVKGPIAVSWLRQAKTLGVTAYHVGLGLWYLRGLTRSPRFIVSNIMMRDWGVSGDAKARALRALETAGLIAVERRGKRSPRVTLLGGPVGDADIGSNE